MGRGGGGGFEEARAASRDAGDDVREALRAGDSRRAGGAGQPLSYPGRVRRVVLSLALLGLVSAGAALLLPRRFEVVREARVAAPPPTVLAALAELPHGPAWATWQPARERRLRTTSHLDRGLWFDVLGPRHHRAAIQVAPAGEGSRVIWSDVLHVGLDPLTQVRAAWSREERVGGELERSLEGLRALLE